jgi:hypothetical protein
VDQDMPMVGSLSSEETRTFKEIKTVDGRRMARIVSKSVVPAQKLGNRGNTKAPGMPEFEFEMPASTGTGEHLFDLDWGRLHRSSFIMETTMEVPLPTGTKMSTTSKFKTTVEAIY